VPKSVLEKKLAFFKEYIALCHTHGCFVEGREDLRIQAFGDENWLLATHAQEPADAEGFTLVIKEVRAK